MFLKIDAALNEMWTEKILIWCNYIHLSMDWSTLIKQTWAQNFFRKFFRKVFQKNIFSKMQGKMRKKP